MKTYHVSARISKETKAMIRLVCKTSKISESLYLRRLIRKDLRHIKAHEPILGDEQGTDSRETPIN